MKISLHSYRFAPQVGGIETVSGILAEGLAERGHEVRVVTQSPSSDEDDFPFTVLRKPHLFQLFKEYMWADIICFNNISLSTGWLALLFRKPFVISYHITLDTSKKRGIKGLLLNGLMKRARKNITVSQYMQSQLPCLTEIINNPYDDDCFSITNTKERRRDVIFVGRLVSDKGCDLLLRALAQLRREGLVLTLGIIGDGDDYHALKELAVELELDEQVTWFGVLKGADLAERLNQSRLMVVPSRWEEPFGIVALEGLACGCNVIVSDGGGLPEAVRDLGIVFKRNDVNDLSQKITEYFSSESCSNRETLQSHLSQFSRKAHVDAYEGLFESLLVGLR